MTRRHIAFAAVGVAALLGAGILVASNMGFKLAYDLYAPGSSGSVSGMNTLALPFIRQVDLDDASDLIDDINADAGSSAVLGVSKFLAASDSLSTYTGSFGTNFPLTAAEGYYVQVNTDVTYNIAGSHDPSLILTFEGPGPSSSSGYSFYAHPYHAVSTTAGELLNEIDAWAGESVAVSIQRFIRTQDNLGVYSGFTGQTDFALVPGEAYFIAVSSTTTFVPAHY